MVRVAVLVAPPTLAEIVAVVLVVTFAVFTEKVVDVFPAGIVAEAGTVAELELLESVTIKPPGGAGPLRVRVPVLDFPPPTLAGTRTRVRRTGGFTVSFAEAEPPEIVATVWLETAVVFTAKLTFAFPAGTVTLAGTVAELELLESLMAIPPVGAGPVRITPPAEEPPPIRLVGLSVIEETTGGRSESVPVTELGPNFAATAACFVEETAVVFAVNVTLVAPARTVTEAGTVTLERLLESFTSVPPFGARPLSITVPVERAPPVTVPGSNVSIATPMGASVRFAVFVVPP